MTGSRRNIGEIIKRGRIYYVRYYDARVVVGWKQPSPPTRPKLRSNCASASARRMQACRRMPPVAS